MESYSSEEDDDLKQWKSKIPVDQVDSSVSDDSDSDDSMSGPSRDSYDMDEEDSSEDNTPQKKKKVYVFSSSFIYSLGFL